MIERDLRRRFYAEELEAVAKLRTPALVEAFANVPRERFLPTCCFSTAPSAQGPPEE
jgi:protein-L-isoaspartate O-methyltransferase